MAGHSRGEWDTSGGAAADNAWHEPGDDPRPETAAAPAPDEWDTCPPALLYPNLIDWVHHWLIPIYRREVAPDDRSALWCPQWWRHPEAVIRLSALWRGFEQRRTEPGEAMSAWLRDHLDHHMPILMAETGPFNHCNLHTHSQHPLTPWPIGEPPPGLTDYLG